MDIDNFREIIRKCEPVTGVRFFWIDSKMNSNQLNIIPKFRNQLEIQTQKKFFNDRSKFLNYRIWATSRFEIFIPYRFSVIFRGYKFSKSDGNRTFRCIEPFCCPLKFWSVFRNLRNLPFEIFNPLQRLDEITKTQWLWIRIVHLEIFNPQN